MQMKNFDTKLVITVYVIEIARNLAPTGGFGLTAHNGINDICVRPTLVAMATKTREFVQKISQKFAYVTDIADLWTKGRF